MPWVDDADGNAIEFPEQIRNRFARMIRARSVSYAEAMDILVEMLVHMHPEERNRFLRQVYSGIENHYQNDIRPPNEYEMTAMERFEMNKLEMNKYEQQMQMQIVKMAMPRSEMAMPRYRFEVEANGEMGPMEIDWGNKTTKELDELLSNEKCDFLSEQEMEI